MTKHYVISSTLFKTKTAAEKQINEWENADVLDEDCRVYEITERTKVFMPALGLKEIK